MKQNYVTNGLSDLESEFELELGDYSSNEFEANNDEYELVEEEFEEPDNEYEDAEAEMEHAEDEYEDADNEYGDNEERKWLDEYGSSDSEYEDRIYSALSGEYESSYEMEQEIDRVLYEMEMDYFWKKGLKKLWSKHKNKLLGAAKRFIPGGTLQSLAKLAGGDIRGLLKSDLFKKGLSLAANAVAPGVGGAIAGGLLNSETPSANNIRNQAKQAVQVAKAAYQNMANAIPGLQAGNIPAQIKRFSRQAFNNAVRKSSIYKGKRKQVLQIAPGSIVVVRPGRVIIYS